jgi:hypothetical protein
MTVHTQFLKRPCHVSPIWVVICSKCWLYKLTLIINILEWRSYFFLFRLSRLGTINTLARDECISTRSSGNFSEIGLCTRLYHWGDKREKKKNHFFALTIKSYPIWKVICLSFHFLIIIFVLQKNLIIFSALLRWHPIDILTRTLNVWFFSINFLCTICEGKQNSKPL